MVGERSWRGVSNPAGGESDVRNAAGQRVGLGRRPLLGRTRRACAGCCQHAAVNLVPRIPVDIESGGVPPSDGRALRGKGSLVRTKLRRISGDYLLKAAEATELMD